MNQRANQRANGIVLVRLDGGLGNQMFQYAAGRAESLRSSRKLVLDPRPISARRPDRGYGLSAFEISSRFVSPLERLLGRAATGVRVPGWIRSMVNTASGQDWRLVREVEFTSDANDLPSSGNLILEGHWQSRGWFEDQASAIRDDFQFQKPLPAALRSWAGRIAAGDSVAVHVRRGDYASDPKTAAVHGVLPASYYAAAAERLCAAVAAPRFFVFSDDPAAAEAMLRLPRESSVVVCPAGTPDSESLRLMTLCRHAIIANSTFSWWGAWLAARAGQVVVAPRHWFRSRETPAGLIPPGWILV